MWEKPRSSENLIGIWDFAKSGGSLTRFDEILLDSVKVSLDLREIALESGFFYCWNLGFLLEFGFSAGRFGFFRFLGERNQNWPARVGFWWIKFDIDSWSRSGRPVLDRFRSGHQICLDSPVQEKFEVVEINGFNPLTKCRSSFE